MKFEKCADCGEEIGIWKIELRKEVKSSFAISDYDLVCDRCLIHTIEGYHTGGGIVSSYIKSITRKVFDKIFDLTDKEVEDLFYYTNYKKKQQVIKNILSLILASPIDYNNNKRGNK